MRYCLACGSDAAIVSRAAARSGLPWAVVHSCQACQRAVVRVGVKRGGGIEAFAELVLGGRLWAGPVPLSIVRKRRFVDLSRMVDMGAAQLAPRPTC